MAKHRVNIPVLPVVNGVIPRLSEGLTGVFLDSWTKRVFQARRRSPVLLLPFSSDTGLYPVGTAVSIEEAWTQEVMVAPSYGVMEALFVKVTGKATLKAQEFHMERGLLCASPIERVDLAELRAVYPLIDGAGWTALEGSTEVRGLGDIRVRIFGVTHDGQEVTISGNLGGIVSPESAHTIEHAIIRSLGRYVMVTPKTLRESIEAETEALKTSIEIGYRLNMPEVFGVTSTGMCGNPLTGLAHFYLASELRRKLEEGVSFTESLADARLSALSKVTGDLELTTRERSRVLQGLKRGMMHDDSPQDLARLKAVLLRFPLSPWN